MIGERGVAVRLAAVLLLAAAGCGGGGSAAPDAAPPDAAPRADGGAGGTAGPSPWQMLSCQSTPVADAGPDSADAGAGDADAGAPDAGADPADAGAGGADAGTAMTPPPDLDQPCCDPTGMCGYQMACIAGPTMDTHRCRPTCDLSTKECPFGGVCANFGGKGVCIPASGAGDPCDPEVCESDTVCVGTSGDDATCRLKCSAPDDCPDGQTCTQLIGTSAKACL